jgi:periplasmic protein TonB
MSSSAPRDPDRLPAPRLRLTERKLADRRAARRRIATRVVRPPSAEQRAFDPLGRSRLRLVHKVFIAAVAIVLSALVHGGVYGFGSWFGSATERKAKRDIVAIEVRERPPPEPDKPPPPDPEPEPERVVKPPERRKAEPPPPPTKLPPPAPTDKPPPRVVGLNFESTGQGGSGPAFAAGNTREGRTAERAADPKKVSRVAPPASPNQTASRIPSAGAKYVLPKRKRPVKPPYPAQLQAQGIEAAVMVLVTLDATGKVTGVKIIKSSGYPEFDESARKTALTESFAPATRDGNPIPYTLSYTYRFTLEDQ